MPCPIKVNSNTIELTVHTSTYCLLDLLCVTLLILQQLKSPFRMSLAMYVCMYFIKVS